MTAMWTRRSSDMGFSLLEIIICLGLITTALMAVFRLQAQNLDLQSETRFLTLATHLSQQRLAQISAMDTLLPGSSSGDFGEDFPQYRYEEQISGVPGMRYLFRVRLRILVDGQENTRDYEVQTYSFRPE